MRSRANFRTVDWKARSSSESCAERDISGDSPQNFGRNLGLNRRSGIVPYITSRDYVGATGRRRGDLKGVFEISHRQTGRICRTCSRGLRDPAKLKQVHQKFFCSGRSMVRGQKVMEIRERMPGDEAGCFSALYRFVQRRAGRNVGLTIESNIDQDIGIEQNGQRYFFASD